MERSILDGLTVEGNVDVISARLLDFVKDVVGTISVVGDFRDDVIWTRDLHIERITTDSDGVSITVDGVDLESAWATSLAVGESITFGVGTTSITLFHQRSVGRSLDGLSGKSNFDGVATRECRSVRSFVSSVLCVVELAKDRAAIGIADCDGERIVTGGDVASLSVSRLNDEGGGFFDS